LEVLREIYQTKRWLTRHDLGSKYFDPYPSLVIGEKIPKLGNCVRQNLIWEKLVAPNFMHFLMV